MIPVFTDEKERNEYINSFLEGFGKENVIKQLNPKDIIRQLNPKDILKSLSKKDKEKLKKMLMDN